MGTWASENAACDVEEEAWEDTDGGSVEQQRWQGDGEVGEGEIKCSARSSVRAVKRTDTAAEALAAQAAAERHWRVQEQVEAFAKDRAHSTAVREEVQAGRMARLQRRNELKLAWVQCERCAKWRRKPRSVEGGWAGRFLCEMNTWKANAASCDAKEERGGEDDEDEEDCGVETAITLGGAEDMRYYAAAAAVAAQAPDGTVQAAGWTATAGARLSVRAAARAEAAAAALAARTEEERRAATRRQEPAVKEQQRQGQVDAAGEARVRAQAEREQTQADRMMRRQRRCERGSLVPGARVEVRYEGVEGWFAGAITTVHQDGTCDVIFDDGDFEARVQPAGIKYSGPAEDGIGTVNNHASGGGNRKGPAQTRKAGGALGADVAGAGAVHFAARRSKRLKRLCMEEGSAARRVGHTDSGCGSGGGSGSPPAATCPVCFEGFGPAAGSEPGGAVPSTLECGHVFCRECVERLCALSAADSGAAGTTRRGTCIRCPLCRNQARHRVGGHDHAGGGGGGI
jgi:hypothetical protein